MLPPLMSVGYLKHLALPLRVGYASEKLFYFYLFRYSLAILSGILKYNDGFVEQNMIGYFFSRKNYKNLPFLLSFTEVYSF